MNLWPWIRDILVTGTGLGVIWVQVFSRHPSDVLLTAALALTAPTLFSHAKEIISGTPGGSSGGHTSPSSSSPQEPPSGHSSP